MSRWQGNKEVAGSEHLEVARLRAMECRCDERPSAPEVVVSAKLVAGGDEALANT